MDGTRTAAAAGSADGSAPFGLYVHYPYCRVRCSYCDFPIAIARGEPPHRDYLAAVVAELDRRAPTFAGRRLVSVYFGGGTPSLWPPECIAQVVAAARARFGGGALREVTLEANPTDCTPERIAAWRAAGVDRLSIGVQSLDPGELATLGRDHRHGDGEAAVRTALAAGMPRVSADVILGTPGGRGPGVRRIAAIDPGHISVYELTIEPRTPLAAAVRRGALQPLSDDALAEAYERVHAVLTARGYEHYEVSSYARPGHRAVHNSLYWQGAEFLGVGAGAASFWRTPAGGVRETNPRSVVAYLRGKPPDRVELSAGDVERDRLWLGLRTADGVAGAPRALADRLVGAGLARVDGDRILPTLRGFLFADRVARWVVEG